MRTYRSTTTGVVVTLPDDHAVALATDYVELDTEEAEEATTDDEATDEATAADDAEKAATPTKTRRTRRTTTKAGEVW